MWIQPLWRDPFPVLDLHGGYIGDRYPLCVEMPPRAFLRDGTRFSFLGTSPTSTYMRDSYNSAHLTLDDPSSPLHKALCSGSGIPSGGCELQSELVLQSNLAGSCGESSVWKECLVDSARLIKLVIGNRTAVYEWRRYAPKSQLYYNFHR